MKKLLAALFVVLSLISTSCKKDKASSTPDGEYYYHMTLGGEPVNLDIPKNNTNPDLEVGSGTLGSDVVAFNAMLTNYGDGTTLTMERGLLSNYFDATDDDFRNMFTPGNYNYSSSSSNGVGVYWYDKNGVEWGSSVGSGNQAGSSFKIVSAEDFPDPITGTLYLKTKIEFNCKLYNEAGDVKQASGTFVGLFGKI